MDKYIDVKKVAELKGHTSTRALRIAINKNRYIAREIFVKGGTSYEIAYSSLEPEIQEKLDDEEIKSTDLVPVQNNTKMNFISESSRLTALARIDIIKGLENIRQKYSTKKEADSIFLDLYNSRIYLPQVYKFIGSISVGTLKRWVKTYENNGTVESLLPQYKYNKYDEYNSILTDEMKQVFLKFLLHPNKFNIGKAISLSKHVLSKRGIENIPCTLTFRRYAEYYKKHNYAQWILMREGEKAYHDKVEPYIERDISKLEVGDVLIADGHVLNFQVINPFTGKPTRATLVGFLDWKSTALVGYEIMMTESTQCIASALRNAIINLGMIPKIVYQDNGKGFKAKFFQDTNFDEEGFSGVYQNLGIKSVFAKPYNARAKVIERFFKEFQEEFEKMMISYTGTSIEDKPAWMKRGEKLHFELHQKMHKGKIPRIQEVIKLINCWIEYHNSKPCPNAPEISISECLNDVQKQNIDINILNDLMMKTETKVVRRNGVTFLGFHYYNDILFGLREPVYIRYSLFDLSKVNIYSLKGEFICIAKRITGTHPMAYHLGNIKDMEDFKQKIQKQKRLKNKAIKEFKKFFPKSDIEVLEVELEEKIIEIESILEKPKRECKLTQRELQMNQPFFSNNYEKYEWFMEHGCTNSEDRKWLTNYIKSDEYKEIYE